MISLDLQGTWPGQPVPVAVEASEAISECFLVTVDVLSDTTDVDPAATLQTAAAITFGSVQPYRNFAGVVTAMTLRGQLSGGLYWYRLRIEPRVRLFDLTRRSRVFCTEQAATVPQVLGQVLASGIGASAPASVVFDLKTTSYPTRDMVVQYDETDLAFLCRLADDCGIFWILGENGGRESILFGDSNLSFPMMQGGLGDGSTLPFRPSTGMADTGPAMRAVTLHSALVPQGVKLNERSFVNPGMVLQVASVLVPGGLGLLQNSGDEHYIDAGWGNSLAEIRAQEATTERVVLSGETDFAALGAGQVFTLQGHAAWRVNGDYVVTSVQHHAWQSVAGVEYLPGEKPRANGYGNVFRAIPAANAFRPARRTPRPRIPGLIRAVIDGAATGRSDIDASGFYRIVFPFDDVTRPPGQASCPVRLLSPYGGPDEGMHFPLRPGTQVMVAFHNGDPDRPVIMGAVPDLVQQSVVTQTNRTTNVVRTASGITMRFNDGRPS